MLRRSLVRAHSHWTHRGCTGCATTLTSTRSSPTAPTTKSVSHSNMVGQMRSQTVIAFVYKLAEWTLVKLSLRVLCYVVLHCQLDVRGVGRNLELRSRIVAIRHSLTRPPPHRAPLEDVLAVFRHSLARTPSHSGSLGELAVLRRSVARICSLWNVVEGAQGVTPHSVTLA